MTARACSSPLDYAFFLRKINRPQQALAVVEEALLAIDMDRNPDGQTPERLAAGQAGNYPMRRCPAGRFFWTNGGVSRKEFVRLAYGVFKEAGKQQDLVAMLEKKIAAGENRLRRVLARVRFHEGKLQQALDLELAYIERADFDPLTAACRQGMVYEEARRPADAADAYQRALALPYKPPRLPDPDEEIADADMQCQEEMPAMAPASGQPAFRVWMLEKLERLYGALGNPERAFQLALQEMEAAPARMAGLDVLERVAAQAEAIGRQAAFRDWAQRQVARANDPAVAAALHWTLKDYQACVHDLAGQWKRADRQSAGYSFDIWLDRFRNVGRAELRTLLTAAVAADPKNARARLELLDFSDRTDTPEAVAAFESLLETDAAFAFARGKGDFNRTRFRNYFDLAYRLLRLYQNSNRAGKASGAGDADRRRREALRQVVEERLSLHTRIALKMSWPDDVNACLALLVDEADAAALARLDGIWKPLPDCPAKRQLSRRLARGLPAAQAADIGWQHLGGRRAAVGRQCQRAGPGPRRQIRLRRPPLGRRGLRPGGRAARPASPWASRSTPWPGRAAQSGPERRGGSSASSPAIWTVAHLLAGPRPRAATPLRPHVPWAGSDYSFDNGVSALVPDGDDAVDRTASQHSTAQHADHGAAGLLAAGTARRFLDRRAPDRARRRVRLGRRQRGACSATTARPAPGIASSSETKPLGLIGVIDGKVLGNAWLNDRLRNRPAIIDRQTLKVTPLLIDAARRDAGQLVNFAFSFYGKRKGQIILGAQGSYQWYAVDDAAGRLCPVFPEGNPGQDPRETAAPLDTVLPERFARTTPRWMPAGRSGDVLIREFGYGDDVVLAAAAGPLVAGRPWRPELSRNTPTPGRTATRPGCGSSRPSGMPASSRSRRGPTASGPMRSTPSSMTPTASGAGWQPTTAWPCSTPTTA